MIFLDTLFVGTDKIEVSFSQRFLPRSVPICEIKKTNIYSYKIHLLGNTVKKTETNYTVIFGVTIVLRSIYHLGNLSPRIGVTIIPVKR